MLGFLLLPNKPSSPLLSSPLLSSPLLSSQTLKVSSPVISPPLESPLISSPLHFLSCPLLLSDLRISLCLCLEFLHCLPFSVSNFTLNLTFSPFYLCLLSIWLSLVLCVCTVCFCVCVPAYVVMSIFCLWFCPQPWGEIPWLSLSSTNCAAGCLRLKPETYSRLLPVFPLNP